LASWLVAVFASGCTPFAAIQTTNEASILGTSENVFKEYQRDSINSTCQQSSAEACVYLKNPVAQAGRAVAPDSLDSLQTFSVLTLRGQTEATLRNSSIRVRALESGFSASDRLTRVRATGSTRNKFLQIQTYYWLNRAIDITAASWPEGLAVKAAGLDVVVDDTVTGYSRSQKRISLASSPSSDWPVGLSSEIAVSLLGLAHADLASEGRLSSVSDNSQHRDCGGRLNGCCRSASGCSRALASAAGDYLVGVIYPSQPTLGEVKAQSPNGAAHCGQPRSLRGPPTASSAFSACGSARSGDVISLGSAYARAWWSVRVSLELEQQRQWDRLFFNHFRDLQPGETFITALAKARARDQSTSGGTFSGSLNLVQSALGI
jgi:hypothetical protein